MITSMQKIDDIINKQINICQNTLDEKYIEYQYGDDMLSNFNNIAKMTNEHILIVGRGLGIKHIESIITMCNTEACEPSNKGDEKITDAINYLLLLQCILHQDVEEEE